jgi:heme/copper-type cytochrome/quinol oxidase subunit 3
MTAEPGVVTPEPDIPIWRPDPHKLGMAVFISSESIFFLTLVVTFLVYRGQGAATPQGKALLDVGRTAIFSLFLFASSGTVYLADRALRARNSRAVGLWLLVTAALGAVFLAGQGTEYAKLLAENAFGDLRVFGSTFFALTGFHGLHVLVGLVMLLILAVCSFAGDFRTRGGVAVESVSLYWHFVDAVWVVVFSVVYLGSLLP